VAFYALAKASTARVIQVPVLQSVDIACTETKPTIVPVQELGRSFAAAGMERALLKLRIAPSA
tara:strand:- start:1443 stop:1631 length:189 start_codon:yes stop_codon:yes gene_type:complete